MASYYSSPSIMTRQPTGSKLAKWVKGIGIPIVILGAILIGMLQIQAPPAAGPDAPSEDFSAARAMEKLKVIAKEPHPVGTPAHDEVRDYLMAELKALGLSPEIQETVALDRRGESRTLENIMVRLPGTDHSKALMLAAHYDSVPAAPGAADDGAAIAAMLETLRALQVSGPLKNDLIVLMTDGVNTWSAASSPVARSQYSAYGFFANADLTTTTNRLPPGYGNLSSSTDARNAIDQLTRETCTNMKAKGIVIYSVAFSTPGDAIDASGQQLIKDCASGPDKYFLASDAASLNSTFAAIAQGIGALRITK